MSPGETMRLPEETIALLGAAGQQRKPRDTVRVLALDPDEMLRRRNDRSSELLAIHLGHIDLAPPAIINAGPHEMLWRYKKLFFGYMRMKGIALHTGNSVPVEQFGLMFVLEERIGNRIANGDFPEVNVPLLAQLYYAELERLNLYFVDAQ